MSKQKPQTYDQLTEKQKLFIEYYLQTLNATESAIKAGYSEKTAGKQGHDLKHYLMPFMEDRIAKIKEKSDERVKQAIADTDEILEMLTRIARGEEKDAFGLDTSNQDKLKALELLGKANQLYVERVKQDTNVDINVNLIDEDEEPVLGEVAEPLQLEEGGDA